MQKLSEYRQAIEDRKTVQEQRRQAVRARVDEITAANKPLHAESGKTPGQVESDRQHVRALIRSGAAAFVEVECDECGSQLANLAPGQRFQDKANDEPVRKFGCPGCGLLVAI